MSNNKVLLTVNIILGCAVLMMLYLIVKPFLIPDKKFVRPITLKETSRRVEKETAGYAIEKIKDEKKRPEGQPKDLKSVYDSYPESDVGINVISEWQKVSPSDRQKIMKGFDAKIGEAKEALNVNPEDKKAQSLLKVTEMMKKLAASDFNISAAGKEKSSENTK